MPLLNGGDGGVAHENFTWIVRLEQLVVSGWNVTQQQHVLAKKIFRGALTLIHTVKRQQRNGLMKR